MIRNGAYSEAVAAAKKEGPSAVSGLAPLMHDPDPEVRLGVVKCLDAAGGEQAQDAALMALTDEDAQVASRAVMLLHRNPPKGKHAALVTAFAGSDEAFVRAEIPKVAARLGDQADQKTWLAALTRETDGEVRDGLQVALARMGHDPSRQWFKAKLTAAEAESAERWFDAAVYMENAWVVPTLEPLLERRGGVYTSAPDFKPVEIRVCDLAAHAILVLKGATEPAPVSRRRFSADEIKRVAVVAGKK